MIFYRQIHCFYIDICIFMEIYVSKKIHAIMLHSVVKIQSDALISSDDEEQNASREG